MCEVPIPPKPEGATRFVCVSDTHTVHRSLVLPEADVFIHCGDITLCGRVDVLKDFNAWLGELPYKHKIIIGGNHDISFHENFYDAHFWRYHESKHQLPPTVDFLSNGTYLRDSMITINGITIYGSPWVLPFHTWAWNAPEEDLDKIFAAIPENVDVLVTHNPPRGCRSLFNSEDIGSASLLKHVKRAKPLVHVFGHVHLGYGVTETEKTIFVNAASIDKKYQPINAPIVFDIL
eukprot:TRINITY_DN118_c0_g1_i33.p1 TRINITY_DN118_c0_g1~~TRINITY_DN118_c0_g1_i33.p1  ORF type:complete len:234 (-),score=45.58 TRINITY_DN118_c0_g1_i33:228-929(-)